MIKGKRKCNYCKDMIDLKVDKFIKFKGKYIHLQCYIDRQINKGLSKEEIDVLLKEIYEEMEQNKLEKIKQIEEKNKIKLQNKKKDNKEKEYRKQFLEYLKDQYNVNLTNKYFYVKLANINNGTYKGLKEGISCEDLLNMFKKKQRELNNIAFNKSKKGQSFKDSLSRIFFDLAIIVNKYDSYKKWKEKKKILEAENNIEIKKENNKINFEQFNFNNIENKKNNNIDIDSIIDDI